MLDLGSEAAWVLFLLGVTFFHWIFFCFHAVKTKMPILAFLCICEKLYWLCDITLSSNMLYYRPQRRRGKVLFLHMSVILFTGGSPGPHPGGRLRGLAVGGGGLQAHTQGRG